MEAQADIALIGLAVMGQNLVLNMNDHGFTVVVYNRTVAKVDEFLSKEAKGTKVLGAHSIEEMCRKLKRPRRVMMLVKAGANPDRPDNSGRSARDYAALDKGSPVLGELEKASKEAKSAAPKKTYGPSF